MFITIIILNCGNQLHESVVLMNGTSFIVVVAVVVGIVTGLNIVRQIHVVTPPS